MAISKFAGSNKVQVIRILRGKFKAIDLYKLDYSLSKASLDLDDEEKKKKIGYKNRKKKIYGNTPYKWSVCFLN